MRFRDFWKYKAEFSKSNSSKGMDLLLKNLEILNQYPQHKEESYALKTRINTSGTVVCLTEVWPIFSKIPKSHHIRINFKLIDISFFLSFTAFQKMSLHIKAPCCNKVVTSVTAKMMRCTPEDCFTRILDNHLSELDIF